MDRKWANWIVAASVALAGTTIPLAAQAQCLPCPLDPCFWCGLGSALCLCPPNGCGVCQLPAPSCCCPAPVLPPPQPVFQTQYRPLVETQYRQQQVVKYQEVPQLEYRREAYVESVPVTTYRQETVDEGSYQMVWVPRPVTRAVPQTVYQQQTKYRDVAYQTTRRVAKVETQLIPQQHVRYVPEVRQVGVAAGSTYSAFGTTAYVAPTYAPAPITAAVPPVVAPPVTTTVQAPPLPAARSYSVPQRTAAVPEYSTPLPDYSPSAAPAPAASDEWMQVPSRNAQAPAQAEPVRTPGAQSRFSPAPSAASVWMSQGMHATQR
ncbi:MAG: hypothetical protein ACF8TS_21010 [Maioricimonas sp. JB049]